MQISSAAASLPRSGIRTVFELALGVPDAIHLEVGEPSFPTPPHVVDAAHRAALDGHTRYTPNAGIPELRSALADKIRTRNGLDVQPDQVVVTSGGVAGVFSALAALVQPGDDVLVPDPSWPNYRLMLQLLGARAIACPLDAAAGFAPRATDLDRHLTDKTRAIILNSPSNPTGAITEPDELRQIAQLAHDHDLWIISDEVYDEIWFDSPPSSTATFDHDGRVVSCFSMSKTYAMTGWRVGYLAAATYVADAIIRCQEPITSCVNAPAQHAALAAITGPQDCVAEMRSAYRQRRDAATAQLTRLNIPHALPSGAFYLMVDIASTGMTGLDFARRLVAEHGVAVAPGDAFGPTSARWVRISLASSDEALDEGINRLATAIGHWT